MKKIFSWFVLLFFMAAGISLVPGVKAASAQSSFTFTVAGGSSLSTHPKQAAVFSLRIQNNCAQQDTFDLDFTQTFSDWTVKFYAADGVTELIDTNGNGKVDTGAVGAGQTKDFKVKATPPADYCNGAQNSLTVTAESSNQNCGGAEQVQLTVNLIHTGNLAVTKEAAPAEAKVGDPVNWTIKVKNSGSDPIGNVSVNDTLGAGSTYNGAIDFHGNNPSSGNYPDWIYAEIPAGAEYTATFSSTISSCHDIDNEINVKWGKAGSECQTQKTLASVKLIPTRPLIDYQVGFIAVPYCDSASVSIPVTNNGDGSANDLKIKIDKIPDFYLVTPGAGWSYNSGTGVFTYTGGSPAGSLAPGGAVNLDFSVSMPSGSCNLAQAGADLKYLPEYYDGCGNLFITPTKIGSIGLSGAAPGLTVTKSGPGSVNVGETGKTYDISATYNKGSCPQNSVAVDLVDLLPEPFTPVSASPGGVIDGQKVTWSGVTLADGTPQSFWITFDTVADSCYAHNEYTNAVSVNAAGGGTLLDCCGCPVAGAAASFNTYVNDPGGTITYSSKSVNPDSIEVDCSTDTLPYTNPSGNPDQHNDRRYTTEYHFNALIAPLSWNGTTFVDEMQNNQFTNDQIADIKVEVDCLPFPGYQTVTGWTVTSYTYLAIDLSHIKWLNLLPVCPPNTGAKLRISYTVRATRTNDNADSSPSSGQYVDWSYLHIPGFPRGCANNEDYDQGVLVEDFRANLEVAVDVPAEVEKCHEYEVAVNLTPSSNANPDRASLTLNLSGFTYLPGSTTYSGGGGWCSGTKGEPAVSGSGLIWSDAQLNEISGAGSVTFKVYKDCTENASVSATANYVDNCGKSLSSNAGDAALLIKKAILYTQITPQLNWGAAHTVDWKIYVTNGGDSAARKVTITDSIGSCLSFINQGCYLSINGVAYSYGDPAVGWPVNGATGDLTWDLKDLVIPSGGQVLIYLQTDVNCCDENNLNSECFSRWCVEGQNYCQESNHAVGNVKLPHSYALVTVEAAGVEICGTGDTRVKIENPGATHIYNLTLHSFLPKYLRYKSGTAKIDGNPVLDPAAVPVNGGNYNGGWELTWDKYRFSNFAELAHGEKYTLTYEVEPDDSAGGGRYPYASCSFFKSSFKKTKSYVNYAKPCDVNNPNQQSNVSEINYSTKAPNLAVTKEVIQINGNNNQADAHYFPLELGSQVVFRIRVTNNGNLSTAKTNIGDILTPSSQMNYLSAEYSYAGGAWNPVPWTAAGDTSYWNNLEAALGHGIEPGKTLELRLTGQVDNACQAQAAYNYVEVWTGCADLPAMNGANFTGNPAAVSPWSGTLSAACPVYQAKYAVNHYHRDPWNVTYTHNIPDQLTVCAEPVFEIAFSNQPAWQGGVTIYAPLELWDVIPKGAAYVSGSTEFMLPGAASWTAGSDPAQDQITFNSSTIPGGNGVFTRLTWNSANNPVLGSANVPAGQSIKARFKLSFGDCGAVGAPAINRQRLAGYDCRGASGDRSWYAGDSNWSTDHWPNSPDHPWVMQTEIFKPAITLEKSVDKQEASPGEELLYTINIINTGNGGAKNFKLSDSIPAGTALVPGSVTNGVYPWMQNNGGAGGVLEWTSIQAPGYEFPGGAESTVSFKVTVLSTAGAKIGNCARFTDSCCYKAPLEACAAEVTLKYQSGLKVEKAGQPATAKVGDKITYTYSVTNTGNITVSGITLVDDKAGPVTLDKTVLNPGEIASGVAVYTVVEDDFPWWPLVNTAVARGTGSAGNALSATAQAGVTLYSTGCKVVGNGRMTVNNAEIVFDVVWWNNQAGPNGALVYKDPGQKINLRSEKITNLAVNFKDKKAVFTGTVKEDAGACQAAAFKAYLEDRAAGADFFKIWLYDKNGNEIYQAEGALKNGNVKILSGY